MFRKKRWYLGGVDFKKYVIFKNILSIYDLSYIYIHIHTYIDIQGQTVSPQVISSLALVFLTLGRQRRALIHLQASRHKLNSENEQQIELVCNWMIIVCNFKPFGGRRVVQGPTTNIQYMRVYKDYYKITNSYSCLGWVSVGSRVFY